jgi:hypothetical protein
MTLCRIRSTPALSWRAPRMRWASTRSLSPTMLAMAGVLCFRMSFTIASPGVTRATRTRRRSGSSSGRDKTGRPDLAKQFDLQLVSSADEFKSPGKLELKHAVDFLVDWRERMMLAAVLRDNTSTALQLYASPDLGKTFYAASFPGRPQGAVLHVSRPRRGPRLRARAQRPRRRLWQRVRLGRHRLAVRALGAAGVGRERPGRVPPDARHAGPLLCQPEARAQQRL